MSATVSAPSPVLQEPPRSERAMWRLTWLILAIASLLTAGLGVALLWWVLATFAYVSMPATIEQASGVVLRQAVDIPGEASVSGGTALFEGDRVRTTSGSQARIRLFDGSLAELFPDARLRMDRMRTPRLVGVGQPAEAQLGVEGGAVRITVPPQDGGGRSFSVVTPAGVAQLSAGAYTVRVAEDATRISVWDGKATAFVDSQVVDVLSERKIILRGDGKFALADALENVLVNGSFSEGTRGWSDWDQQEQRLDARGARQIVFPMEQGAPARALRFSRESAAQTHNETGVKQEFKWDVSGSRAVLFDMWLRIDGASLSGGGYLGTEYPVMVRIRYQSARGSEHVWSRGFFYANPELRPTRNGQLEGVPVGQGTWTYATYDFLKELQPTPVVLEEIQVLAAGHSFDSYVANLRILVD